MRKLLVNFVGIIILLATNVAFSVAHYGKKVGNVQVNPSNGCIYFTLKGVTEADPILPNNQWFSLNGDAPGADHIMSLLLMSYATGETLKVDTTGSVLCGYAGVGTIRLEQKN